MVVYQERLTLINDLITKHAERTTTHTQPITKLLVSIVTNLEDLKDKDSFSGTYSNTVGQTSFKNTKTINCSI